MILLSVVETSEGPSNLKSKTADDLALEAADDKGERIEGGLGNLMTPRKLLHVLHTFTFVRSG
jgi:hypothetical protein